MTRARALHGSTQGEVGAQYENREADRNIAPFLRLLWDHDLIDCSTNPKDSSLATRIKVQKLVYLAQRKFKLEFRYAHSMYLYGPYSVGLANDYFMIRDICDIPSGGLKNWTNRGDFLAFAKIHNDRKWLEIACTLIFTHDVYKVVKRDELLEYVHLIKHEFAAGYITQVYDELIKENML